MSNQEKPKQSDNRQAQQRSEHADPDLAKPKDAGNDTYAKKPQVANRADDSLDIGSAKKTSEIKQGSTLIPAAVNNLMIAQQYIDGTKFSIEHKLVSFHYGVALLADGRDDPYKRNLAREYLTAAAGWQPQESVDDKVARAANRILCEARYNLGVIEELNENYGAAREQYSAALDLTVGPNRAFRDDAPSYAATELGNVAVLAHLGWISADVAELRLEVLAGRSDEGFSDKFSERVKFPIMQAAILRRQILEFKTKARQQASATGQIDQNGESPLDAPQPGSRIAVSYRHELLDTVLMRADQFVLELYELAKSAESTS